MITIKTTISFDLKGVEPDMRAEYIRMADDYEVGTKRSGIFWGRTDCTTGVAITTQQYLDVVKVDDDEVRAVPVSERSN